MHFLHSIMFVYARQKLARMLDGAGMAQSMTQQLVRAGRNSFDGYVPSVPQGEKLDYASDRCNELETLGADAELPQGRRQALWCTGEARVLLTLVLDWDWQVNMPRHCGVSLSRTDNSCACCQAYTRLARRHSCWWPAAWGNGWATPASSSRCHRTQRAAHASCRCAAAAIAHSGAVPQRILCIRSLL